MSEKDILAVYFSIIRSVIEYADVTYHSMLTKEQSNVLESLQRMCIRVIFGWNATYKDICSENNIESLEERRIIHCRKFAVKCTEHNVFKSWFPLNHNKPYELRAVEKYAIAKYNFNRFDKSPLNFMRRLLNEDNARELNLPLVNRYV